MKDLEERARSIVKDDDCQRHLAEIVAEIVSRLSTDPDEDVQAVCLELEATKAELTRVLADQRLLAGMHVENLRQLELARAEIVGLTRVVEMLSRGAA